MSDKHWLNWQEHWDDDNNTIWEAPGLYSDEDGVFYYRISQKLQDNKIKFMENSDEELLLDCVSKYREEWNTLEDAKYEMNRHFQDIMKFYKYYDNTRSVQ